MSIEGPIPSTYLLPFETELSRSVIRVPIHFYSAPPGIETLVDLSLDGSIYSLFGVV